MNATEHIIEFKFMKDVINLVMGQFNQKLVCSNLKIVNREKVTFEVHLVCVLCFAVTIMAQSSTTTCVILTTSAKVIRTKAVACDAHNRKF